MGRCGAVLGATAASIGAIAEELVVGCLGDGRQGRRVAILLHGRSPRRRAARCWRLCLRRRLRLQGCLQVTRTTRTVDYPAGYSCRSAYLWPSSQRWHCVLHGRTRLYIITHLSRTCWHCACKGKPSPQRTVLHTHHGLYRCHTQAASLSPLLLLGVLVQRS